MGPQNGFDTHDHRFGRFDASRAIPFSGSMRSSRRWWWSSPVRGPHFVAASSRSTRRESHRFGKRPGGRQKIRGSPKRVVTIGVLFGCFSKKTDGDSWFTWWFDHLPEPPISLNGHLWLYQVWSCSVSKHCTWGRLRMHFTCCQWLKVKQAMKYNYILQLGITLTIICLFSCWFEKGTSHC